MIFKTLSQIVDEVGEDFVIAAFLGKNFITNDLTEAERSKVIDIALEKRCSLDIARALFDLG